MQTGPGYDLGEALGIELPVWTLYAATGIVGLFILHLALKPKAAPARTSSMTISQNRGSNG